MGQTARVAPHGRGPKQLPALSLQCEGDLRRRPCVSTPRRSQSPRRFIPRRPRVCSLRDGEVHRPHRTLNPGYTSICPRDHARAGARTARLGRCPLAPRPADNVGAFGCGGQTMEAPQRRPSPPGLPNQCETISPQPDSRGETHSVPIKKQSSRRAYVNPAPCCTRWCVWSSAMREMEDVPGLSGARPFYGCDRKHCERRSRVKTWRPIPDEHSQCGPTLPGVHRGQHAASRDSRWPKG